MRYQYRYTKDEKRHLAAANRVLDDPNSPPREVNKALQHIQRIQDAAECRAFDRAITEPPPTEPTVDDLVSALETAQKRPFQPIENKGPEKAENAIEAISEAPEPAKASEDAQTVPEPATAFCSFCHAAGPWNTRWPIEEPNGVLLCPGCFGRMCTADSIKTTAKAAYRSWLYEKGETENTFDLSAAHGARTSDFAASVRIWEEQARDDTDRRIAEAREREAAEAEYHSNRADWIQNGGRL